eukprot:Ihof_evm4s124 gene=Ihof_evmTU4s124
MENNSPQLFSAAILLYGLFIGDGDITDLQLQNFDDGDTADDFADCCREEMMSRMENGGIFVKLEPERVAKIFRHLVIWPWNLPMSPELAEQLLKDPFTFKAPVKNKQEKISKKEKKRRKKDMMNEEGQIESSIKTLLNIDTKQAQDVDKAPQTQPVIDMQQPHNKDGQHICDTNPVEQYYSNGKNIEKIQTAANEQPISIKEIKVDGEAQQTHISPQKESLGQHEHNKHIQVESETLLTKKMNLSIKPQENTTLQALFSIRTDKENISTEINLKHSRQGETSTSSLINTNTVDVTETEQELECMRLLWFVDKCSQPVEQEPEEVQPVKKRKLNLREHTPKTSQAAESYAMEDKNKKGKELKKDVHRVMNSPRDTYTVSANELEVETVAKRKSDKIEEEEEVEEDNTVRDETIDKYIDRASEVTGKQQGEQSKEMANNQEDGVWLSVLGGRAMFLGSPVMEVDTHRETRDAMAILADLDNYTLKAI